MTAPMLTLAAARGFTRPLHTRPQLVLTGVLHSLLVASVHPVPCHGPGIDSRGTVHRALHSGSLFCQPPISTDRDVPRSGCGGWDRPHTSASACSEAGLFRYSLCAIRYSTFAILTTAPVRSRRRRCPSGGSPSRRFVSSRPRGSGGHPHGFLRATPIGLL